MEQRSGSRPGGRGLTVKQLTFVFVAGVVVCAVFFALGFLVGANERNANSNSPTVERVSPPGDIPPPVNPPLNAAPSSATSAAGSSGQVQEENLPPTGSAGATSAPAPAPVAPAATSGQSAAAATPSPTTSPPKRGPGPGLIVQVAALHSEKDATSMVATLRAQDYPAFLVTPEQAGTDDSIYRVQIGPYPTRPAAQAVEEKLAKEGFNPFIK